MTRFVIRLSDVPEYFAKDALGRHATVQEPRALHYRTRDKAEAVLRELGLEGTGTVQLCACQA